MPSLLDILAANFSQKSVALAQAITWDYIFALRLSFSGRWELIIICYTVMLSYFAVTDDECLTYFEDAA